MSRSFLDSAYELARPFNPVIAGGVAERQMANAHLIIDEIIRRLAGSFPPGFEYLHHSLPTPKEEYLMKVARGDKQIDLARSDVYLMKLHFAFQGKPLPPQAMYVPFFRQWGEIYIRGALFTLIPVLTSVSFDVSKGSLFLASTKFKFTFSRNTHPVLRNGTLIDCDVHVSKIHKGKKEVSKQPGAEDVKCDHMCAIYLFIKYGITEAFRRYLGIDILLDDGEATVPEGYTTYESIRKKPSYVKVAQYIPTRVRIHVRDQDVSRNVESFVGAAFYNIDRFPDRLTLSELDCGLMWGLVLMKIVFGHQVNEGKLQNELAKHNASLERYVDADLVNRLAEEGIYIETIYDLLAYVICNATRLLNSNGNTSMVGKKLVTSSYVLSDITTAIVKCLYTISHKKSLTEGDILTTFRNTLRMDLIKNINSDHREVKVIASPNDNGFISVTHIILPQSKANGEGKKDQANGDISLAKVEASIALNGMLGKQTKADPGGKDGLNQYGTLSDNYVLEYTDEEKQFAEWLNNRLGIVS